VWDQLESNGSAPARLPFHAKRNSRNQYDHRWVVPRKVAFEGRVNRLNHTRLFRLSCRLPVKSEKSLRLSPSNDSW
jgi:hypothetical protein